jgi:hypothetical protein
LNFATDECHFDKFVHQVEDGAHGGDPLIEPLTPVPKPDGIKGRVADQMDGFFVGIRRSSGIDV